MARLFNFDYKTPYFYMVTLKRLPGLNDFSAVDDNGQLVRNALTYAFEREIAGFHQKWRCIEPISPFVVMPDHIHLMIKIKATPDRVALGVIVSQLAKTLRGIYWEIAADAAIRGTPNGPPHDIFEKEWHDWIVKRDGQLAAFRRYIRENPVRAAVRRRNAAFFGSVHRVSFLGRDWFAYGNTDVIRLPMLIPLKGHRAINPEMPEWDNLVATAARIGPGGAGVSTFMSPLEKACGNAIAKAGGKWIVLSPEGFHPRWHPSREKERFCAQGRMLFLSLYDASTRKPSRKMLYDRCHEMIDLVCGGLGGHRGDPGVAAGTQDP